MTDWLSLIREYAIRKALPTPRRAALLVIDMQEYFRPLAEKILPGLARLIQQVRSTTIPIVYTAHQHTNPEQDGGMLGQWWEDLILANTPESRLLREIAPQPGDRVFTKCRYSAFSGTDLDLYLSERKIKDLIISGVMTNLCCETTARDAFVRDYRVFFLADGTATSCEDLHLATLKNMAFGFSYITTCQEMINHLISSKSEEREEKGRKGGG